MYKAIRHKIIGAYLQETESLHDQSRITLFFNITFSVFIIAGIAATIGLITGSYATLVPTFGNMILTLISLVILSKHKLRAAALLYFGTAFFLLFGNLIFNDGTMHVGAPFWIMILDILVIYILGRKWGILFLTGSAICFIYYVIFVLPHSIEIVLQLKKATYYAVIYEGIFVMFLLGYLIGTILKASKDSDALLLKQNNDLLEQNELIVTNSEEKSVMLKEIHHRVKNNLQIIISLMRLKSIDSTNPQEISNYQEMINRVMAMAQIHEKIYQSEEMSRINMETYFKDLSRDLLHTYITEEDVKLNFHIDDVQLELDTIVPLALIYNELFSNSLKHAFDSTETPLISVELKKNGDSRYLLSYHDNGTWKERSNSTSLGTELVDSLTEQLNGTLKLQTSNGTKYTIEFGES